MDVYYTCVVYLWFYAKNRAKTRGILLAVEIVKDNSTSGKSRV